MNASGKVIFLSYASQDAEVARRICEALRGAGLEVWFDQSELRGGDAWDASIRKQIRDCALFVPIISATTQGREEGYFRREWNLAAHRTLDMTDDKAFLLPVVIDATLDANARVPEKFREVQWTHLPTGAPLIAFTEHVQRLLAGGVAAPVAPVLSLAGSAAHSSASSTTAAPSIAVLPFVNRSHDEEDEYFSDGLADELLNVLAKIRGLRVAARTSSFQFKGKNDDIAVIGRKLNVATVLEGSLRKVGNRMRISVQLVKVSDGYHLWSESYDRTLEDIFAVQDDIAQSVVKELRTTLLGEAVDAATDKAATAAVAAAAKGRATDPEAHRLYLQARYFGDRNTREDTTKGIGYLKEALARDPEFAMAWAELGMMYSREADRGWATVGEGYGRAREAVLRALALEPELAEGHVVLGHIQLTHDWDWLGAEASCRRALALAPGSVPILRRAAVVIGWLDHLGEAIELCERALAQDPLSTLAYNSLASYLYRSGRLTEADAAYRKALELAPQRNMTHAHLALNLLAQGRGEEALAEALQEPEEWERLRSRAIIDHAAGRYVESEAALQELIAKHQLDFACQVAQVYAVRAEPDLAFAWLERAYVQRDPGLSQLKTHPLFRALYADPRWGAFLRKMKFAN